MKWLLLVAVGLVGCAECDVETKCVETEEQVCNWMRDQSGDQTGLSCEITRTTTCEDVCEDPAAE